MQKIENAINVLGQNIIEITTVSEWAEKMNYTSEQYFSTKIRDHFGKRAKQLIVEQKLLKVKECLDNQKMKSFIV